MSNKIPTKRLESVSYMLDDIVTKYEMELSGDFYKLWAKIDMKTKHKIIKKIYQKILKACKIAEDGFNELANLKDELNNLISDEM